MDGFAESCHPHADAEKSSFTPECSKEVHERTPGLDWAVTEKCVTDTWFDSNQDNIKDSNTLLDREMMLRADKNILQLPTAIINGVIERGGISPFAVLSTICSGFAIGSEPAICACASQNPSQAQACIDNNNCNPGEVSVLFCSLKILYLSEFESNVLYILYVVFTS